MALVILACENIRFPSLFAARDVSRSSARNVPSGEERGETDVLAGYGDFRFLYLSTAKLSEIKNLEGYRCQNHDFL